MASGLKVNCAFCVSFAFQFYAWVLTVQLEDASDVTWDHAVNSRKQLRMSLEGSAMFLEADVSLGYVKGVGDLVPIMAHPPMSRSDISLADWMAEVVDKNSQRKGIKLDFKSTLAVNESFRILQKWKPKITFPLWLNADVLEGPVSPLVRPVEVTTFLSLCKEYFPDATMSLGWTTSYGRAENEEEYQYSWNHVWSMARAIRCAEIDGLQPITFPIRAAFVKRSIPQLLWLIKTIPSSSLTVWSSIIDPEGTEQLLELRRSLPLNLVYYDLHFLQDEEFQGVKGNVTYVPDEREVYNWGVLRDSTEPFGCDDTTLPADNAIVYGGRRVIAAFLNRPLIPPVTVTGNLHPYELSDYDGFSYPPREGVVSLIFAEEREFWSEGKWMQLFNHSVLSIGVQNPEQNYSCCRASFEMRAHPIERTTTWNVQTDRCLSSDKPCAVYTEEFAMNVSENQELYVGFVFRGERGLVLENLRINGVSPGAGTSAGRRGEPLLVLTVLCGVYLIVKSIIQTT